MLAFIIPLKSAQASQDWRRTSALFERCLKSTCNQTSKSFKTIVVCNEKPSVKFYNENIVYVQVDFLPPKKETNKIAKGLTDKGRKVLKGIIAAQEFLPSHVMTVDADDCVSNRLAEFVSQNSNADGWYFKSGWKYRENDSYVYIKHRKFYTLSGTANIIHTKHLELPEQPEYNRGYGYYRFYIDHQRVRQSMEERGVLMRPLPFPGAIYILSTGDNMSQNEDNLSFSFLNRRALSQQISSEFGLYPLVPKL
jgi:(2Fe-2S) ferredoxin